MSFGILLVAGACLAAGLLWKGPFSPACRACGPHAVGERRDPRRAPGRQATG